MLIFNWFFPSSRRWLTPHQTTKPFSEVNDRRWQCVCMRQGETTLVSFNTAFVSASSLLVSSWSSSHNTPLYTLTVLSLSLFPCYLSVFHFTASPPTLSHTHTRWRMHERYRSWLGQFMSQFATATLIWTNFCLNLNITILCRCLFTGSASMLLWLTYIPFIFFGLRFTPSHSEVITCADSQ